MANRLQFKRGNGAPLAGALQPAEPGYDLTNDLLYLGNDSGDVQIIGGKSYVDRVDAFLDGLGNLSVGNNAGIIGTLGVTGAATFQTNVEIVSGGLQITAGTFQLPTGVAADAILDEDDFASNSATALPTQQSVKAYVDTFLTGGASDINVTSVTADTLTANVNLDVNGTSDFQGFAQFQSNVDIDGTLDVQLGANFQSSLTVAGLTDLNGALEVAGTTTLEDTLTVNADADLNGTLNVEGAATFQNTVRIEGNLEVAGTATEISFQVRDVAIEDRLIELGMEAGAAPTSATDWDLGIAMNYNDGSAKKAAVVWTDNTGFNLAAQVTESQTTGANDPQIAVDSFAALGVDGLHIGDVIGGNATAVINSDRDASFTELYIGAPIDTAANKFASFDGTFVQLENTAFDGGTY